MALLAWVAVLVGAWCAASVVAALAFGAHRRRQAARGRVPGAALDPLTTGPMRLWLAELPETPEPARPLTTRPGGDGA